MPTKPPPEFLEELGWIAIRWSGLEMLIETSCAHLFKAGFIVTSDKKPPRPFNARIKFIRQSLAHPAFVHLRCDYEPALREAQALSVERNDLMHGAFTSWSSGAIRQTLAKSADVGYIAIQDVSVSEANLEDLAERIGAAFAAHFNLQDRMKSIIRAYDGSSNIGRRATFDE